MKKPMMIKRPWMSLFLYILLSLTLLSCETVQPVADVVTGVGVATGKIGEEDAGRIRGTMSVLSNTFEDFTPEQEYYLGRAVAANILAKYKPYTDQKLTDYVNLIGSACSVASLRPETFGGYHFLVLDSEEINAFAAPGGLVFLTRGLVNCCKSEDELASVIAHEIAHVQYKHGLQAIRQDRITKAIGVLAQEALKDQKAVTPEMKELFDGSIKDITMTLITNGYSQQFEFQADQGALAILGKTGYHPGALIKVLQTMNQRLKPGGNDFYKTHPSPDRRIAEIGKNFYGTAQYPVDPARQKRFQAQTVNLN
jgi:predicted Zn-dependent protease